MTTDRQSETAVVAVAHVRRSIVDRGDLRNEVGYQNDINLLLSSLDGTRAPWEAVAPLFSPARPPATRRSEAQPDSRLAPRMRPHRAPALPASAGRAPLALAR